MAKDRLGGAAARVEGMAKGVGLIAAGAGLVAANAALARKLRQLDAHVRRTASGVARVYTVRDDGGERVRVLNVGGAYQSATYLGKRWAEPVLEYYRAFDHMFEAEAESAPEAEGASDVAGAPDVEGAPGTAGAPDVAAGVSFAPHSLVIRDVLMIGGGGCAWPKHAIMTHPSLCVDVVEADPAIAEIARRYFFVDELERELRKREGSADRFSLIVDDGLGYLAGCEKRYDVICNDAFRGAAAASELACASGIRAVRDRLNPGGLYLVNVVSDSRWREFRHLIRLINQLDEQFAHVKVIFASDDQFGGKDNYLVIASDADYAFTDEIPYGEAAGDSA